MYALIILFSLFGLADLTASVFEISAVDDATLGVVTIISVILFAGMALLRRVLAIWDVLLVVAYLPIVLLPLYLGPAEWKATGLDSWLVIFVVITALVHLTESARRFGGN